MTLQIKNWAKFQHFKDRRPPWVKLYRDLLDDREWHKLDGDSAKLLVSLWLIGSEDSGNLPSVDELAFRLRLDEKHVEKCLKRLEHWLISDRYQDDINVSQKISATDIEVPLRDREETETEREKETEEEKSKRASRLPNDSTLSDEWFEFCKTERPDLDPLKTFESFKDHFISAPGQKGTKLNWFATWRNWVRNQHTKKPTQNGFKGTSEPLWRTEQRRVIAQAVPGIAARSSFDSFDVEAFDVTTPLLD